MLWMVVQVLAILLLPYAFMRLAKKSKAISFVGPVVLCYVAGIILTNVPGISWDRGLSMTISEVSVPIAIALILFSANLLKWFKLARSTVFSFVLVLISAMLSSFIVGLAFAERLPDGWKVAGMLTGCYTGGTPNLMAVGLSLELPSETIVLVNMCDMLAGGVYFLLLTSVIIRIYRKVLPPFDETNWVDEKTTVLPSMEPVFSEGKRKGFSNLGRAVGLAVLITGVAVGIAILLTGKMSVLPIILIVTTVSIGLSFLRPIKNIKGTSIMGQYAVYIFSLAIGGTVDIQLFFDSSPTMLLFTACVMMGALFFHLILCRIFRIDADTALITSTAGVYGPAFIAPVAEALNNRHVVMSGLITGIVGYVAGNYLGIGIAYLIRLLIY